MAGVFAVYGAGTPVRSFCCATRLRWPSRCSKSFVIPTPSEAEAEEPAFWATTSPGRSRELEQ